VFALLFGVDRTINKRLKSWVNQQESGFILRNLKEEFLQRERI